MCKVNPLKKKKEKRRNYSQKVTSLFAKVCIIRYRKAPPFPPQEPTDWCFSRSLAAVSIPGLQTSIGTNTIYQNLPNLLEALNTCGFLALAATHQRLSTTQLDFLSCMESKARALLFTGQAESPRPEKAFCRLFLTGIHTTDLQSEKLHSEMWHLWYPSFSLEDGVFSFERVWKPPSSVQYKQSF